MKFGKNLMIGVGLIAVAVILAVIMNSVSAQLVAVHDASCDCEEMTAGGLCPALENTVPTEVYLGYSVSAVLIIIGIYLIFSDQRVARFRAESAEGWNKVTSALQGEEKTLYDLIAGSDGVMFQSDLVEKSGLPKVKVSRVLDRLEARNLLERRRRGMSNVVILKTP